MPESGDSPIEAKVTVTREQAFEFRDRVNILSTEATARTTSIFWSEFLVRVKGLKFNPELILTAINDLESGTRNAGTKPATPLKREPLKGLWHKHYFDPRFMLKIILDGNGGEQLPRLRTILEEESTALNAGEDRNETILRIRDRFMQPFVDKSAGGRLTGEWIVYLPYQGKNYYLCFGDHADETSVYHRVHACRHEPGFKDILKWWEEVRGKPISPL